MGRFNPVDYINDDGKAISLVDGSFVLTQTTLMTYAYFHEHMSDTCLKIVNVGSGYIQNTKEDVEENYRSIFTWIKLLYGLSERIEGTAMDWFVRRLNTRTDLIYTFDVIVEEKKTEVPKEFSQDFHDYFDQKSKELLATDYPNTDHGVKKTNKDVLGALVKEMVDNYMAKNQ